MIYNLYDFSDRVAGEFKKPFIPFPYVKELCYWVERCVMGDLPKGKKNIAIAVPPRHYKTTFISQNMPAWAFGEISPDCEFMQTSATATLATNNAIASRKILDESWYKDLYPQVRISKADKDIQNHYRTTMDGAIYATGLGGTLTGMGAGKTRRGFGGAIIIDDPLKADDAHSQVMRESVIEYYVGTLKNRRNNIHNTPIILVAQRLHTEDLIGWVLENEADEWHLVSFPALRENKVLNPLTTSVKYLESLKQTAPHVFYAQYQQTPVIDGGTIFLREWIKYWKPLELPERFDRIIQSWDMTFKGKEDTDYVVGQVWGQAGANHFLLDQERGRWGFTDTIHAVKRMTEKWPTSTAKYVEDKANGPAVIDALRNVVAGLIPVEPDGSKTARAYAVTPLWHAGNVFIPDKQARDWVKDFEAELLQFPAGSHDDQVDAMTQALSKMSRTVRAIATVSYASTL